MKTNFLWLYKDYIGAKGNKYSNYFGPHFPGSGFLLWGLRAAREALRNHAGCVHEGSLL